MRAGATHVPYPGDAPVSANRRLLRALTGEQPLDSARQRRAARVMLETLRNTCGYVGLGAAYREAGGVRSREPVLKLYVVEKQARHRLARAAPSHLTVPWSAERVDVDVEAVGVLRPQRGSLRLGSAVHHQRGEAGTLGCVVIEKGGARRRFILSNAHVLAPFDVSPQVGDTIVSNNMNVASLTAWKPLQPGADRPNTADVAIAEINRDAQVDGRIPGIGLPTGHSGLVFPGMEVFIHGAATGRPARSTITDTNAFLDADYPTPGGTTAFGFRRQVFCEPFTEPGDSGSAVLNSRGRIVGLHFWGSNRKSVFNPFNLVLSALAELGFEVQVPTSDRVVDLSSISSAVAHVDPSHAQPEDPSAPGDISQPGESAPAGTNADTATSANVAARPRIPNFRDLDDATEILAQTVWAEAQGEGVEGMEAVAEVIINRLRRPRRFASTVEAVCQSPCQFSCWNDGRSSRCPRRDPMVDRIRNETSVSAPSGVFVTALAIARATMGGHMTNHTNGADHYYASSIAEPRWAGGKSPSAEIGNHRFYNDIA